MIKFFRHIRQRLLAESRFSKYLLYAIGEVVLVVIGILIALQINTWNEGRKNNNTAQHYLNTLQAEFELNKETLGTVMTLNEKNATHGLAILDYTGPEVSTIREKKFDSILINTIGYEVEFRPNNEIIDEVITSGKLSLFRDADLRTALSSWAGALQRVRFQEAELSKYRFQLLDLSMQHINLRDAIYNATGGIFGISESRFKKENKRLLQLQEFESVLTSFVGASKFADQRFIALEEKIDQILSHLNQALNKTDR